MRQFCNLCWTLWSFYWVEGPRYFSPNYGIKVRHFPSVTIRTVCCLCLKLVKSLCLGLTSEGIYRKSGVNSRVAALLERFRRDARSVHLREGEHQVDDVSNTLKRFFRELEEGLFTSEDSRTWLSAAGNIHNTIIHQYNPLTLLQTV